MRLGIELCSNLAGKKGSQAHPSSLTHSLVWVLSQLAQCEGSYTYRLSDSNLMSRPQILRHCLWKCLHMSDKVLVTLLPHWWFVLASLPFLVLWVVPCCELAIWLATQWPPGLGAQIKPPHDRRLHTGNCHGYVVSVTSSVLGQLECSHVLWIAVGNLMREGSLNYVLF